MKKLSCMFGFVACPTLRSSRNSSVSSRPWLLLPSTSMDQPSSPGGAFLYWPATNSLRAEAFVSIADHSSCVGLPGQAVPPLGQNGVVGLVCDTIETPMQPTTRTPRACA